MGFRALEKARLSALKVELFGPTGGGDGLYRGRPRPFCLPEGRRAENLEGSLREGALRYFSAREISWHDGHRQARTRSLPSNHLCCSQSFCVNTLFPFRSEPTALARFLRALGYEVREVLPLSLDRRGDEPEGYVGFEWIGTKNYLGEFVRGRPARDKSRKRGAGFTSADFFVRFRREDGRIQVVLGEWKYTELYAHGRNLRFSASGTDRLKIYGPHLQKPDCQIVLRSIDAEALFFDPFDQLMRLQLLATAMMREKEMEADLVTVLHVAPRANRQLMEGMTSPQLANPGSTIHQVWFSLVRDGFFVGINTEQFLEAALAMAPASGWADYMRRRYRWTPVW